MPILYLDLHVGLHVGLRVRSLLIGSLVVVRTGYPHGEVPIMYIHVMPPYPY